MLHPQTTAQFEAVRMRYPEAKLRELPSGAATVTLPSFPLPEGWSARTTDVTFIVPVGYPGPVPDCFWASAGLRLANGAMPQASQDNHQIPEAGISGLWFSWHVTDPGNWHPNRDTLKTYVGIIAERFRQAR